MLHIFKNCFLSNGFFDPSLCLHIIWISVQPPDLRLPRQLNIMMPFSCLPQELGESCRIRVSSCSQVGLDLDVKRLAPHGDIKWEQNSPVEAATGDQDCPRVEVSSSPHLGLLVCQFPLFITDLTEGKGKEAHLPPRFGTFRLSNNIAFDPTTPNWVMVALGLVNSLPLWDMLCSPWGIPD